MKTGNRSRVVQASRGALAPGLFVRVFEDGINRANGGWFTQNDQQSVFAEKRVRGLTLNARTITLF